MKNDVDFEIEAKIKIRLTEENIDDIMTTALEGGINYWCSKAEVVEDRRVSVWGHEQIARGGMLILHDSETDDKWELDLKKFLNGIKLWVENELDQYGAIQADGTLDCGEIDADIADLIIQYAIFGEQFFG